MWNVIRELVAGGVTVAADHPVPSTRRTSCADRIVVIDHWPKRSSPKARPPKLKTQTGGARLEVPSPKPTRPRPPPSSRTRPALST